MSIHRETLNFECFQCEKESKSSFVFDTHIQCIHDNICLNFICFICDNEFNCSRLLTTMWGNVGSARLRTFMPHNNFPSTQHPTIHNNYGPLLSKDPNIKTKGAIFHKYRLKIMKGPNCLDKCPKTK